METSIQTLQKLLNTYAVSPVILDVFHAFGAKVTGDDDPFFNLCHFAETGSLKEGQDRYLGKIAPAGRYYTELTQ